MTSQSSYAKLLKNGGWGEGILFPTQDVQIGDVAYFSDSTYHRIFNALELSKEEADRRKIPQFRSASAPTSFPYKVKILQSKRTKVVVGGVQAEGPVLPGLVDLDVTIRAEVDTKEVAICLPSYPVERKSFTTDDTDLRLRSWWENYRHNIACHDRVAGVDVGPLFIVLEMVDTEQWANCYYKGTSRKTNLKVLAKVLGKANLAIEAGFQCTEAGDFGFKGSGHIPNEKWAIFMRSQKLSLVTFSRFKLELRVFWHRLLQTKGPSTERPEWADPSKPTAHGNTSHTSTGTSSGTNSSNAVVETFSVSVNWTLIKARGKYYAEYCGETCPDELYSPNKAEDYAFTALQADAGINIDLNELDVSSTLTLAPPRSPMFGLSNGFTPLVRSPASPLPRSPRDFYGINETFSPCFSGHGAQRVMASAA